MPWDRQFANGNGHDPVLAPPAPAPHQPAAPSPAEHEAATLRRPLQGHDSPHRPSKYSIPEKPLAHGPTPGDSGNPNQMPPPPTNPPNPADVPARPVVKMKRTGNIGSFPMSLGPSALSTAASRGTPSTAHRHQATLHGPTNIPPHPALSASSAPSTARPGDHPHQAMQSKLLQSSLSGNEQQLRQHSASFAKPPTSGTSLPRPFFQKAGEQKVTASPPTSTRVRPSVAIPDSDATDDEDSQPAQFPPSALETHDRQSSMESTTATRSVAHFVMNAPDDPDSDSDSSFSPMMESRPRKRLSGPAFLRASQPDHQAPTENEERSIFTPASALDDTAYRTYIAPDGKALLTHGVLIPPGYKVSQDASRPWICPIRSCRVRYLGMLNLRSHFVNSHRATCLNDNLDGTLTIVGSYAGRVAGNGMKASGVPRPAILVSKGPMSLSVHPLAPEKIGSSKQGSLRIQTPKRQATKSTTRPMLGGSESDEASVIASSAIGESRTGKGTKGTSLQMANPDRAYNQWPDEHGMRQLPGILLLPDDYVPHHRVPGRPWICPIRSCRQLYKNVGGLARHWKSKHGGCHLNDNLDGTFTLLAVPDRKTKGPTAAVVVSQELDDSEPIVAPKRPKYTANRGLRWDDVPESDVSLSPEGSYVQHRVTKRLEASRRPPDHSPQPESSGDSDSSAGPQEISSNVGILFSKSGRRYTEWTDAKTGDKMADKALALPDDYKMCDQYPSRPWVCPVRSCRVLCKSFKGMGNHFNKAHRGQHLNDNGDGTLSIVPAPRGKSHAIVVSQNPLDPSEPPMAPMKIPLGTTISPDELKRGVWRGLSLTNDPTQVNDQASKSRPGLVVTSSSIQISTNSAARTAESCSVGNQEGGIDPAETWAHICSHLGKYPMPTGEGARSLLRLPRVRPLQLDPAITTPLSDRQIMAILINITGVEWDAPCTRCRRSPPPFHACVRLVPGMIDDPHVVDNLRSLKRCCANCIFGNKPYACSVKNPSTWENYAQEVTGVSIALTDTHARESPLHQGRVDEGSDADEEDEVPTWNLRKRRRRSPSPSEEPPLKRKVVTMRVHPNKLGDATASTTTGAETSRVGRQEAGVVPQEDVLEMEDWELEQGHIPSANASSSTGRMSPAVPLLSAEFITGTDKPPVPDLATHVSIGQTIRLSKDVTVSIDTISAGAAFQFPANGKQTRVCTMIAGKLKVQVDGEEEFAIGSRSMFRIAPGAKCLVVNGYYADAVVHVTTLTE
ncbi:hypothetical protein B0T18DRAFT_372064 [Schizothecium vesticola]|uniref:C2H2-type domain-containing protein n=1 Tax=Schizothecium vesticola TaxID=314040 RepID=A0AA40EQZ2_9PEZI|nr:hypothetical protein B0T18DRAFT_372064 [Schizothecium vesticola]